MYVHMMTRTGKRILYVQLQNNTVQMHSECTTVVQTIHLHSGRYGVQYELISYHMCVSNKMINGT